MKIEKAIEVLQHEKERIWNYHNPERRKALELGIEALDRIRCVRQHVWTLPSVTLPFTGETEE